MKKFSDFYIELKKKYTLKYITMVTVDKYQHIWASAYANGKSEYPVQVARTVKEFCNYVNNSNFEIVPKLIVRYKIYKENDHKMYLNRINKLAACIGRTVSDPKEHVIKGYVMDNQFVVHLI